MSRKIVIVGGVAAGASAATRARRLNEQADIIVFEKSGYVSFANCGLPYYVGDVIKQRSALLLQTPEQFKKRFNIDVHVRHEVTRIDRKSREVEVADLTRGTTRRQPYDVLILTPGAAPLVPPIPGVRAENVFVLRTIEDMDAVRRCLDGGGVERAAVIGAGFIGLESAEILVGRGVAVNVIELADQVLPPLDPDMAAEIEGHLRDQGVVVHLGQGVERFEVDGNRAVAALLPDGTRVETDMVLMGIGVRPNSKLAADAGLELGPRGHIRVNQHLQTSDPDILAAGDVAEVTSVVTGEPIAIPLAGPANKHGRLAGQFAATGQAPPAARVAGTAIVKVFDKVAAVTGLGVKAARAAGIELDHVLIRRPHHVSYYPGAEAMNLKLTFHPETRKVLGAQIVGGEGIEARIDVVASVLHFGGTVDDLSELDLAYAPQFGAAKDPVHIAAFVAANQLDGLVRHHTTADLDLCRQQGYCFVDVRTLREFERGTIPGAIHVELDDLRGRLPEIPRERPVLVFCAVGQRGYNAARILMQHGYSQVFNLAGGYEAVVRLQRTTQRQQ